MEGAEKTAIGGINIAVIVFIAGINLFLSFVLLILGFANGIFELVLLLSNLLGLAGAFWLSSKRRRGLGLLAIVGVLPLSVGLTAAVGSKQHAEWREEVALTSGRVIVVSRSETRHRSGGHSRWFVSGGTTASSEIEFPDGEASWRGGSGERPMALEMKYGKIFIAVDVWSRELCAEYFYPRFSVVYLLWNGKSWERIEAKEYPVGGKVNVLQNPWGDGLFEGVSGLVKNADKELTAQHNELVNQPLEKVLAGRPTDACASYKRESG